MAHPLTERHIEAERRLRVIVATAIATAWNTLPRHDRENLDQWLSLVVPLIAAGRRQSASLTDGYLARFMDRAPFGIDVDDLNLRNGTPLETVYERPFVTIWTALDRGEAFEDALNAGLARAMGSAEMDVQMAMRATADAVERQDDGMYGFERTADAIACDFCRRVDGAYVKFASAMPLHNRCGCSLTPLTQPHSRAATLPSGVAVHRHGELGPMLGSPDHDFTSQSDIT